MIVNILMRGSRTPLSEPPPTIVKTSTSLYMVLRPGAPKRPGVDIHVIPEGPIYKRWRLRPVTSGAAK